MDFDSLPAIDCLFAAADAVKPPLESGLRLRLSVMNFLQFAVWGAWFVVLGQYLNTLRFSGRQIGSVYATMSLGAIISPMIVGSLADTHFNSESVMAFSHLAGAALLVAMAYIRTPRAFYLTALAYALVYAPTLSVSNAVIFAHIPDATRDFPTIRVLGTIGWIAANLFLKVLLKPGDPVNNRPLLLAALLSVALGLVCFLLPNTPPKSEGLLPFQQALGLFKEASFAVFYGVSFLISIALAFYFSFTSLFLEQRVGVRPGNVGPLMTIGQWMEIFFFVGIPTGIYFGQNLNVDNAIALGSNIQLKMDFGLSWFLEHFGMKTVLLTGMAAWAVRYAIFALGRPFPLVILALALHGLCFDFFIAAGFIHVEKTAPADIRNSGQALFSTLVYGLGMYLGTEASGWINHALTREAPDPVTGAIVRTTNWPMFWLLPCLGAIVSLALFVALF